MSKITLPTSGSRNWGGGLNAYLEHLDNRLSALESFHNSAQNNSDNIINVGYPCSGFIGEVDIEYSSNTVSFSGIVYIGSNTNCYFRNVNISKNLIALSLASDKYYFVFLKYSQDGWDIECYQKFEVDDTYVLLGMYYNDNFIPYYFSSSRNLSMHLYDLQHRWADFNQANVLINIGENGQLDLYNTLIKNSYKIYCEGLGMKNIRPSLLNPTGCVEIDRGVAPQSKILIEDREEGGIIKSVDVTSTGFTLTTYGSGICYRLLVDIFGNLIIQKSVDKNLFSFDNGYWCEQQLYNTRFNHFTNYEAGLWVEIGRFGYNQGEVINFCYDQANFTNGLSNFAFGKARNYDANQLSNNIWLTKDSQIWLDKVEFKNSQNAKTGFWLYGTPSFNTVDTVVSINNENCEIYGENINFYTIPLEDEEYKLFKTITLPYHNNSIVTITSDYFQEKRSFNELIAANFMYSFANKYGYNAGDFIVQLKKTGEKATFSIYCHLDGIGENATDQQVVNYWHSNHWIVTFDIILEQREANNMAVFNFTSNSSETGIGTVLWENNCSKGLIHLESKSSVTLKGTNIFLSGAEKINLNSSDVKLSSTNCNLDAEEAINLSIDGKEKMVINDVQTICYNDLVMDPGKQVLVYSDQRLKTNIKNIKRSYSDIVTNVPIVNFNYKNDNKLQIGIIAQQLQKALSEDWPLFISDIDNNFSIKETKLIYLLWAALQEEIIKRENLEAKVSALESNYEIG